MRAGRLRHRVVIERNTGARAADGGAESVSNDDLGRMGSECAKL